MANESAIEKLSNYKYPEDVTKHIREAIVATDGRNSKSFEQAFAKVALQIVGSIERKNITTDIATTCFIVILQYLTDHARHIDLSENADQLLIEGMLIHDLGKNYGADLPLMKSYAKKIIGEN